MIKYDQNLVDLILFLQSLGWPSLNTIQCCIPIKVSCFNIFPLFITPPCILLSNLAAQNKNKSLPFSPKTSGTKVCHVLLLQSNFSISFFIIQEMKMNEIFLMIQNRKKRYKIHICHKRGDCPEDKVIKDLNLCWLSVPWTNFVSNVVEYSKLQLV